MTLAVMDRRYILKEQSEGRRGFPQRPSFMWA